MSFCVVIPARYASTRLPGKALLQIAGRPMVQHVWDRAQASGAERVIIATDDTRIEAAATAFGAEVVMTRSDHPTGTDRLAEVVERMGFADDAILVNVQGDEPLIPPAVIDQVAHNLAAHPDSSIATLCEEITSPDHLRDPNVVKVVCRGDGMALYFSRACVPWPRDHDWSSDAMPPGVWLRHIGLYAYRASFLRRYSAWSTTPLEHREKLEQLRALEEGEVIHVAEACDRVPAGVDTPADLEVMSRLVESEGAPARR